MAGPLTPRDGDRVLVACDGGPSRSRLVRWPVPLEIPDRGGAYVLVDSGPIDEWRYRWVPDAP